MKLRYNARAHAYWLDGKRCKSPSAMAKVPDDSRALDLWRRRQTAIGLALQPTMLTEVAAAAADKEALDAICERAMTVAGASSGRDRGTAVHLITEMVDAGKDLLETPEVRATREAWTRLLGDNGLTVVRSEAVVVHPELAIAGRFDRSVLCPDGKERILDIKTGTSADVFVQAHCVQLWLYAAAPLIAVGPAGDVDFEVTEFEVNPGFDTEIGLVAHLPLNGPAQLIAVDIASGGRCFHEVIWPTYAWRTRRDLTVALPTNAPEAPAVGAAAEAPGDESPASPAESPPVQAQRREWVIERVRTLFAAGVSGDVLARWWPADVPTFAEATEHTDDQLDAIVAVLNRIEAEADIPFGATDPAKTVTPTPIPALRSAPAAIDEGAALTDAELDALSGELGALASESKDRLDDLMSIVESCAKAGKAISVRQRPSERRAAIARALIACVRLDVASTTNGLRELVHLATGESDALQLGIELGAVIGSLSIDHARRLERVAVALAGPALLGYGEDGRPTLVASPELLAQLDLPTAA